MAKDILNSDDKTEQLKLYRDLVIATVDYFLDNKTMQIKTADFDSDVYYNNIKLETVEQFQKGHLAKLKQWFRDFSEIPRETRDLKFNAYIKSKTGHDINIFADFTKRIDKIISKGKITTDNQFYDVGSLIDILCQAQPVDNTRIQVLNKLIADYETRKTKK